MSDLYEIRRVDGSRKVLTLQDGDDGWGASGRNDWRGSYADAQALLALVDTGIERSLGYPERSPRVCRVGEC